VRLPVCFVLAFVVAASLRAAAQAPAPTPVSVAPGTTVLRSIEAIPDPARLTPAELPYVHPLWRPLDAPPKLLEHGPLEDLETRVWIFSTVKLAENGRVTEGVPVEPPLKALVTPLPLLYPRWKLTPAKKAGKPVVTWATYGAELNVSLEKGIFAAFELVPVGKEDPLPRVVTEHPGEEWMSIYPKEPSPAEPGVVSVEECDTLPMPDSNKWSFDAVRTRSRITALVEISDAGKVTRILPTGDSAEPLILAWLRKNAAAWTLTPATAGGKAVASWMVLDAALDYTVDSAKKKAERSVRKNLRGLPFLTRPS
jgi:hypothetical protein